MSKAKNKSTPHWNHSKGGPQGAPEVGQYVTGSVVLWQRLRFSRKCCTIPKRTRQETGRKKNHKEREMCPVKTRVPLPYIPLLMPAPWMERKRTEKRERIWDVLPEAQRRWKQEGECSKFALQAVGSTGAPALRSHSSLLHVLRGYFSGLLKCTYSCRWLLWILFSVSETRRWCGESEAETGRNSQLCGQGEISSPNCTPVFLQSSH